MTALEALRREQTNIRVTILGLEDKFDALQKAIDVLEGTDSYHEVRANTETSSPIVGRVEEEPREVPSVDVRPQRSPKPVDTRPFCNACGSRMEPSQRTLQSGKTVNLLICTDSGCNNEVL
jgi:hypothetical protein